MTSSLLASPWLSYRSLGEETTAALAFVALANIFTEPLGKGLYRILSLTYSALLGLAASLGTFAARR